MKVGLCLPQLGPYVTEAAVREFAVRADGAGFDSLWVQEHLFFPEEPTTGYAGVPGLPIPEPYRELLAPTELLAYVAGLTSSVRIGTSILVPAYHRPVELAKRVATLDVLSRGRMVLGLGLGWSQEEYAQSDSPWDRRAARATEFIRAVRACWGHNPMEFSGEFFRIPRCDTSPTPLQRGDDGTPAVPILGAFNSAAGIPRVAELCDGWNPAGLPAAAAAEHMRRIDELAAAEFGRGPLQLVLRAFASPALPGVEPGPPGMMAGWTGSVEEMVAHVEEARDVGVAELVIDTNFFDCGGEDGWIAQPEFFAPLLEVARAGTPSRAAPAS